MLNNITNIKIAIRQFIFSSFILIAILNEPSYSQVNLTDGLLAYYPFNGNADDESGNFNHGTGFNVVPVSDRFGFENRAFDFNAAYISIPSSSSLESPTTELSMVAWVYREPSTTFSPIIMKSESTSNAFQYRMHVYNNGIGSSINDWNNGVGSEVPVGYNKWHLIVITLKNGVLKGYFDGIHIDTDNMTGSTIIALDTHDLEIGRDRPGATEHFNGKIDDVRIYNREINAQEVMALFDEGDYQQLFNDGFEN